MKQEIPLIVVNRFVPEIGENCTSLDNQHGGYLATRHLIEQGHKDIAYISGSLHKADSKARLAGHKRALNEYDLPFDPELTFEGNFSAQSGEQSIRLLLQKGLNFTAVSCGNDEMAAGAINALEVAGKQVPKDISVVGFDNINYANYLTPKLTTVEYPMHKIGTMAAHWILEHAYGSGPKEIEHLLSPKLIVRDSTRELS